MVPPRGCLLHFSSFHVFKNHFLVPLLESVEFFLDCWSFSSVLEALCLGGILTPCEICCTYFPNLFFHFIIFHFIMQTLVLFFMLNVSVFSSLLLNFES